MASGIGGFLRGLFGGGESAGAREDESSEGEEQRPRIDPEGVAYKGFTIHPAPRKQGGQWLTAGVIRKDFGGETKEHAFIRADTCASKDDAASMAVDKAKRIIDERGDRMFG